MKIAIIGAGLAGVAAAWELSKRAAITLFDPLGIAGGASGAAPGLLHPYGGYRAKKSWHADEGMAATRRLLETAPDAFETTGILRLVTSQEQSTAFAKIARQPDVEWIPAALAGHDGILIHSGITVRIQTYLERLWAQCNGELIHKRVNTLEQLADFDRVVICTGPSQIPTDDPNIRPLKGQIVRLAWPRQLTPPAMSLIGKKYLVMSRDRLSCQVGATFERDYTLLGPDLEIARTQLIPPIAELYPELIEAPILDCIAGIRATTPDHLPIIRQLDSRTWSLRGFGSKGLLYHALYAQMLATQTGLL